MPELDDDELVDLCLRAADEREREEAYRRLFERHYPLVFAFFRSRGFPTDECKDLAQEIFLRVYRKLALFRGEASFTTWLFKVAANFLCNTLRERSAQKREGQELSLDAPADEAPAAPWVPAAREPSPLEDTLTHERERLLHQAIQELPAQMRRCVMLRVVDELKYREIAATLHISIETVKAHLFQARQRLKTDLGDHFTDVDL